MYMAPVPFVDLSSMWLLPSRRQRILCCLGGLIFEMTFSSLAVIAYCITSNEQVQFICCMFFAMGVLSSILVNASPFMKFDGYHVLAEILSWPNLYSDAQKAFLAVTYRMIHPWRSSGERMQLLLALYGLLCFLYRCVLWTTLILAAYVSFHAAGALVIAALLFLYVLRPLFKSYRQRVRQQRSRRPEGGGSHWTKLATALPLYCWYASLTTLTVLVIFYLPFPLRPTIPGVIDYHLPHVQRNETEGFLVSVCVRAGDQVKKDALLAKLENPLLEREKRVKELEVMSLREEALLHQSRSDLASSQSVRAKLQSAEEQLQQLVSKLDGLMIRSPVDGKVVQFDLHDRQGQYLKIGENLGIIASSEQLEVVSFVEQRDVDVFEALHSAKLRVRFADGTVRSAQFTEIAPRGSDILDFPQLAATYGGPLVVQITSAEDGHSESKLTRPRFKMRAILDPSDSGSRKPGESVTIALPDSSLTASEFLYRFASRYWFDFQRSNSQ